MLISDIVEEAYFESKVIETALDGKNDLKILSYCYNFARTIREIAEFIGVTPSTYFRRSVITRLVESGLLREYENENGKQLISNKEKNFIK